MEQNPRRRAQWLRWQSIISIPIAIIGTALCIYHERLHSLKIFLQYPDLYTKWFYPLNHIFLAIAIFSVIYYLEKKGEYLKRAPIIASISDKYSYDIYLSHHIWIQNPISLFNLSVAFTAKCFLVLIAVCFHTVLTRFVAEKIDRNINKLSPGGVNLEVISRERNALMGLSMMWIVFFHSTYYVQFDPILNNIHRFGNMGVDWFLFLSGIGLFYSMKEKKGDLIKYYKKRFLRIIPTTIICLTPWIIYLYKTGRTISVIRFLLDITSLGYWIDGVNRGWYVALAIVLYLIYPVFFVIIERGNNYIAAIRIAILVIIADIFFNFAVQAMMPNWYNCVEGALSRIPVFVAGCFFAPLVYKRKHISYPEMIVLFAIGVLGFGMLSKGVVYQHSINRYIYMLITVCVIPVLAAVFSKHEGSLIHRFFSWVGIYTLEIYLTHTQILSVLEDSINVMWQKPFVINTISIILSMIISVILHKFVLCGIKKIENVQVVRNE